MSLITDLLDGVLEGTGWAAGVAIVVGVAAVSARRDSPLVKEAMKACVATSERVRELVAEAGEQLADLYAEAKAEYEAGATPLATLGTATAAAAPASRRRSGGTRSAAATPPAPETPRRRGRARANGGGTAEGTTGGTGRQGRRPRAGAANAEPGAA
jgi:hypothetical protein